MTSIAKYLAPAAAAIAVFATAAVPLASAQTYYPQNYGYQNSYQSYQPYQNNNSQAYNPAGHITYQNGTAYWTSSNTYSYTTSYAGSYPTYQNSYQPYQNQYSYQNYSYPSYNNSYSYNQYPQYNNYNYGTGHSNSCQDSFFHSADGTIRYTASGVAYWQSEQTPSNDCW